MQIGFRARFPRQLSTFAGGALLAIAFAPWNGASAYQHNVIHNYCTQRACAEGSSPRAGLIMDSAGNLYGTAGNDGQNGDGTVFQMTLDPLSGKWRYMRLHSFCNKPDCADGANPNAKLIMDVAGNLYGTTANGGVDGSSQGVVFEVVRENGRRVFKVLHQFNQEQGGDGSYPSSGLTYAGASSGVPYDGVSPLYGTTASGGANSQGIAFRLTKTGKTWTETVLYSFCSQDDCTDGAAPASDLIADVNGHLFGTTRSGGTSGHGVAFELSSAGDEWILDLLHNFCSQPKCADGGYGYGTNDFGGQTGALLIDGEGNLIGSTPDGGARKHGCCGVIFKIVPNGKGSEYSVLYNFCSKDNCLDGANPHNGLIIDQSGNIFGTTRTGGGHNVDSNQLGGGTVFELSGSTLQTLYAFCSEATCLDGEYPSAGVIMDAAGNLFGVTQQGGRDSIGENEGDGTVFELSSPQ